jgi:hypothetical protein
MVSPATIFKRRIYQADNGGMEGKCTSYQKKVTKSSLQEEE